MPSRARIHIAPGFTLIEVLVVIAVIATLAAILFPVFTAARGASKRAVCQSNMRQLHMAFHLYASDWEDTLPCPGGLVGDLTYWSQENGGGLDVYLKCRQMGGKSVYCCPQYTGRHASRWSARTYGMNSFLRAPADIPYPLCINILSGIPQGWIKSPSNTILLYEGIAASATNPLGEGYVDRCGDWESVRGYYPDPINHWADAHKPVHGDRNNYLMCDGHVVNRKPEKYPAFRGGPTSPENNLWYARKLR